MTKRSSKSGSKQNAKPLAFTAGEPAGIGPDLLVRFAQGKREFPCLAYCDATVLAQRAAELGLDLSVYPPDQPTCDTGQLNVHHVPLPERVQTGQLDARNAKATLAALAQATDACLDGSCAGLVTGPVQKSIINDAGVAFSGHTEFLMERSGAADVLMLLVSGDLRVALATTHLPLREVADALTQELVTRRMRLLQEGLKRQFALDNPVISLCGLNPHAGEGGHLGREEIEVLEPAVRALQAEGVDVRGPLPADTAFVPAALRGVDAVMAMYHDQGLPVLKAHGFGEAVNVTLGLPFVRTSVDHGTALDLAGSNQVDTGSFEAAVRLAQEMVG